MHDTWVSAAHADGDWDLLNKTELRIERIGLDGADLTEVAATVAACLGLDREEVVVIDAHDALLALDILRPALDAKSVAGRSEALLAAVGRLPGVRCDARTAVAAEGMLGWIAADRTEADAALRRSREMSDEIRHAIAARAVVFSTGPEVISGQIRDTNKPWIAERLRTAGYTVAEGADLPDDTRRITSAIREAAEERGFGLIVTTGGVGAEGKDGTVEALLAADPEAATPYLFEVRPGRGRHAKPGVRIGVGEVAGAVVVCLPGPHAEAATGTEALVGALARTTDKGEIAAEVAGSLRARFRRSQGVPS